MVAILAVLLLWAPDWAVSLFVALMAAVGSYELLYCTGLQKNLRLNLYSALMACLVVL